MFIEIDDKIINLHSITAVSTIGGGEMKMTRIHLIGGYIDIKEKYRSDLILALKNRMNFADL
jgi:hypothetical protein